MSDCIETVIAEYETRIAAMKVVAEQYPGCTAQHYEDITLWIVDMPHEECDSIHTWSKNNAGDLRGKMSGYAVIFKNIGLGVNIAPVGHYLQLSMFAHHLQGSSTAIKEIAKIFKEHA